VTSCETPRSSATRPSSPATETPVSRIQRSSPAGVRTRYSTVSRVGVVIRWPDQASKIGRSSGRIMSV